MTKTYEWATEVHLVSDNGANITAATWNRMAIVVLDGSFKNQHGIAAFFIEGEDPQKTCSELTSLQDTQMTKAHYAVSYRDVLVLFQW